VLADLNRIIERDDAVSNADNLIGVQLPEDVRQMLADRPRGGSLPTLNRRLVEAAFPADIRSSRTGVAQLPRDLLVLPIGAVAYGAVFLLLATMMNRSLIVGLLFAFGWESWVPMMPGSFKLVSLMTYLRALAPHARPESASTELTSLFAAANPEAVPSFLAWWVLPIVTVVALGAAAVIFSLREYVPKDDSA
jgi:hypothetical protein